MSSKRGNYERAVEYFGAIVLFGLFGLAVYFICIGRGWSATALLPLMGVAFVVARMSDITKIHFFKAFEAELRQRLQEVNATISQLQELAVIFAEVSVRQLRYGDRMDGISPRMQMEMVGNIASNLRQLEVAEDKIVSLLEIGNETEHYDYFQYVMQAAYPQMTTDQTKAWNDWSKPFMTGGFGAEPEPAATEAFLAEIGLLHGEVKERLEDYQQYHRNRTHRRLDAWLDRHKQ